MTVPGRESVLSWLRAQLIKKTERPSLRTALQPGPQPRVMVRAQGSPEEVRGGLAGQEDADLFAHAESVTTAQTHSPRGLQIVCRNCSRNKYPLKYLKDRMAKVCDGCFGELKKRGGAISGPMRGELAWPLPSSRRPSGLYPGSRAVSVVPNSCLSSLSPEGGCSLHEGEETSCSHQGSLPQSPGSMEN